MGKLKLTVNEGKTRICKVPRPKLENGEVRRRQDCDADHIDCSNAGPLSTFSKSQRVMSVEGNCSDVGNPTSDAHPATVFAMEWLHALLTKAPPPDKVGFIYMLKGGSAGTRPHAPLQSHTSVIRGLRRCCLVPVLFNSRCSDHGANVDVVPTPSCCLTASTSPSTQISVI